MKQTLPYITRLIGALRSGNRAAYLGIVLKALKPFTRPLDKMLAGVSHIQENPEDNLPPCVMLVSPPRSGSTIIYQTLIRAIPSVYISNFHTLFPGLASDYLLKYNLLEKGLSKQANYYGYTSSLWDVNEGNEMVEAFFRGDGGQEHIREKFCQFIRMMRGTSQRPLIFKNVRAYSQILELHQAVPELVFLRIRRDTEQVIQSVVRAYYELGTFHPIPETLRQIWCDDPIEFAIHQILEIERIIDRQKEDIEKNNWLEWHYEDFCTNPWSKIECLAENYLNVSSSDLMKNVLSQPLQVSKRMKVSPGEADTIHILLQKYRQIQQVTAQ